MSPGLIEIISVILAVLLVAALLTIASMVNQFQSLKKQVHFIARNDTNKNLTFYNASPAFRELAKDMNQIIDGCREREKEVKRQDSELKDTLVNMSHDIRTPLTSLKGYFEILNETTDPNEQERYRTIISERIESLSEILEAMFYFTKISSSNYQVELDSINLTDITMQTLFGYFDDFENASMTPELDIEENVYVLGNEQALKRILQNFIKNCLVHGKSDVSVSLKALPNSDYAAITFSNKVFEESVPDVNKVFDRFYKGDTARHVSSSGIGLSVTRKLAHAMKGQVYANMDGDIFRITLELQRVNRANS